MKSTSFYEVNDSIVLYYGIMNTASHLHCLITWYIFNIYTVKHTTAYDFSYMYTFNLLTTTSAMCIHFDTNCKSVFHILCHHNAFKIHSISLLAFGRQLHKVSSPYRLTHLSWGNYNCSIKWCCEIETLSRNINKPSINWSMNSIILCLVLKIVT